MRSTALIAVRKAFFWSLLETLRLGQSCRTNALVSPSLGEVLLTTVQTKWIQNEQSSVSVSLVSLSTHKCRVKNKPRVGEREGGRAKTGGHKGSGVQSIASPDPHAGDTFIAHCAHCQLVVLCSIFFDPKDCACPLHLLCFPSSIQRVASINKGMKSE